MFASYGKTLRRAMFEIVGMVGESSDIERRGRDGESGEDIERLGEGGLAVG